MSARSVPGCSIRTADSSTAAWSSASAGLPDTSSWDSPKAQPAISTMAVTTRECAGVTGACLATRRETFESQGQFDESLGVDLNDIDYCLRAQRAGLRVLYEPSAELIHHESPSRGTAGAVGDIVRFIERWKSSILAGDPFLNPNLTRVDSSCALRGPDEEEWWHRWYVGLSDT